MRHERSRPSLLRRLAAIGAVTATVLTGVITSASSASAATARNGVCESGEFCYYYNSNHAGSLSDFTTSISDLGDSQPSCYEYKSAGAGQGLCVKNDAAAVWNRTSGPVTVYFNSGYGGASQTIASGGKVNLNATLKNENASHRLNDGGGTTRVDMSDALYVGGGGRLTAAFDGYKTTPGRHEGIDFAKGGGAGVKALLGGRVINIERGGSSLSTISIYSSTYDKSIIYLHTAPLSSLSVGQTISKGQQIATEDDRGSAGAIHTHVEMRLGQRTNAAKSVNDPTLDNPNPNSFWQARGYNVR